MPVREKIFIVATAFWGAAAGLLVARFALGASGTQRAEEIAFIGFFVTFGAYIWLRMKEDNSKARRAAMKDDR